MDKLLEACRKTLFWMFLALIAIFQNYYIIKQNNDINIELNKPEPEVD